MFNLASTIRQLATPEARANLGLVLPMRGALPDSIFTCAAMREALAGRRAAAGDRRWMAVEAPPRR